jgi:hypothetical protein
MVIGKSGTAYVGWIGSPQLNKALKAVNLCVLPVGATVCQHGVQSTFVLDNVARSSAVDLKVLMVGTTPTLVWFHDDTASEGGPQASEISAATVSSTGVLGTPSDVATAPSFGSMLDAEVGPDGQVWTVTYPYGAPHQLQVRDGLSVTPVTIATPYSVGFAHLAFTHTTPVIAITEAGSVKAPVAYSYESSSVWKPFASVAKTWAVDQDFGLANTASGLRLVGTIDASTYLPVVAKWNGHGFSARTGTGDRNKFAPTTHDTVSDASGRLVDASQENSDIAVANLADTTHAAVFRFSAHGIVAPPEPQAATTPRGHGWVLWAVEDSASGGVGDRLSVAPFRLAGLHRTRTKHGKHGTAVLTGAASCLPASTISVGVAGHPQHGWKVASRTVTLDGASLGKTLNGASLTPGKSYTMKGVVVFRSGHHHSKVTARLSFRACPTP